MAKPKILFGILLPKTLHALLTLGLLITALFGMQIAQFGTQSSTSPADAAIVLGAAVYRGEPSPVFRERINHAITLYQTGQVEWLIFTGGIGSRDEISEAEAARNYAIANGVPAEVILLDTSSLDTYTNLSNAQLLMENNEIETVLIVSDPYHMLRASLIAEELGIDAESSPTPSSRYRSPRTQLPFLMREAYFMVYYTWQQLFGQSAFVDLPLV